MYRTSSTTRVSDEYYMSTGGSRSAMEFDNLPICDPQLEISKKETARLRFAVNMVHLIPVVIIICAMVLWICSSPEIEIATKDDSILPRIKNMTIDGYRNLNETSVTIGREDLDPVDGIGTEGSAVEMENEN